MPPKRVYKSIKIGDIERKFIEHGKGGEVTKDVLKKELDRLGIKYPKNAPKYVLYKLLVCSQNGKFVGKTSPTELEIERMYEKIEKEKGKLDKAEDAGPDDETEDEIVDEKKELNDKQLRIEKLESQLKSASDEKKTLESKISNSTKKLSAAKLREEKKVKERVAFLNRQIEDVEKQVKAEKKDFEDHKRQYRKTELKAEASPKGRSASPKGRNPNKPLLKELDGEIKEIRKSLSEGKKSERTLERMRQTIKRLEERRERINRENEPLKAPKSPAKVIAAEAKTIAKSAINVVPESAKEELAALERQADDVEQATTVLEAKEEAARREINDIDRKEQELTVIVRSPRSPVNEKNMAQQELLSLLTRKQSLQNVIAEVGEDKKAVEQEAEEVKAKSLEIAGGSEEGTIEEVLDDLRTDYGDRVANGVSLVMKEATTGALSDIINLFETFEKDLEELVATDEKKYSEIIERAKTEARNKLFSGYPQKGKNKRIITELERLDSEIKEEVKAEEDEFEDEVTSLNEGFTQFSKMNIQPILESLRTGMSSLKKAVDDERELINTTKSEIKRLDAQLEEDKRRYELLSRPVRGTVSL